MDHRHQLVIAALLGLFSIPAWSGFAQAAPPAGYSSPAANAPYGTFTKPAANAPWINGRAAANVSMNVGGRAVTMPAAMRMAGNAGRFAATGAWNPLLLAAMVGVPLLMDWYLNNGFKYENGVWKKGEIDPGSCTVAPCYVWRANGHAATDSSSGSAACNKLPATGPLGSTNWTFVSYTSTGATSGSCVLKFNGNGQNTSFSVGTTTTRPPDAPVYSPTTQAAMESAMDSVPIPDAVANSLGDVGVPLPVQQPVINPDANDFPSVYRMPMGEPQPVPNTNPQQYRQPVVDAVPAPTPGQPWRMDLVPRDVVSESPTGVQSPQSVPKEDASTGTETKEQQDICAANPDILACQHLDQPDAPDLPTRQVDGIITPDSGWGAGDASCPPPRVLTVQGRQIPIPYTLFCTYMSGIRPIVIAMAWLAAGFILVGAVRGNE